LANSEVGAHYELALMTAYSTRYAFDPALDCVAAASTEEKLSVTHDVFISVYSARRFAD
jgi:hypothetical protein